MGLNRYIKTAALGAGFVIIGPALNFAAARPGTAAPVVARPGINIAAAEAPGVEAPGGDAPGVARHVPLSGYVTGAYHTERGAPDTGAAYALMGQGAVQPVGQGNVSGSFHALGNVRSGQVTGSLLFVSASGTLHLSLLGPQQKGLSPPPDSFTWRITGGTGSCSNWQGTGTVLLSLSVPTADGGGDFKLTF